MESIANITTMESVVRKLSQQIRQHEIRLDILKHDSNVLFVLEKDEIAAVTVMIEDKIAHLRDSIHELNQDVSDVRDKNRASFPDVKMYA